jgi:hypothetical protein
MRDRGYSYVTPSVLFQTIISQISDEGSVACKYPPTRIHLTKNPTPIPEGLNTISTAYNSNYSATSKGNPEMRLLPVRTSLPDKLLNPFGVQIFPST